MAEIPDFLSAEECQEFIDAGNELGLNISGLFGEDIYEHLKNKTDNSEVQRISDQTWVRKPNLSPGLWTSLFKRYMTHLFKI